MVSCSGFVLVLFEGLTGVSSCSLEVFAAIVQACGPWLHNPCCSNFCILSLHSLLQLAVVSPCQIVFLVLLFSCQSLLLFMLLLQVMSFISPSWVPSLGKDHLLYSACEFKMSWCFLVLPQTRKSIFQNLFYMSL